MLTLRFLCFLYCINILIGLFYFYHWVQMYSSSCSLLQPFTLSVSCGDGVFLSKFFFGGTVSKCQSYRSTSRGITVTEINRKPRPDKHVKVWYKWTGCLKWCCTKIIIHNKSSLGILCSRDSKRILPNLKSEYSRTKPIDSHTTHWISFEVLLYAAPCWLSLSKLTYFKWCF